MFVPDYLCPRCGGSIIPDDAGGYQCMMCGRAITERDGSIVLLVERECETEHKDLPTVASGDLLARRRGWGMRSR